MTESIIKIISLNLNMVHTDKVVRDVEFDYEGVFNFKEFILYLKDFFKRYDYDIDEKSYSSSVKDGLKNEKIKWDCDRKLDDYNHAHIKLKINLNDFKESYAGSKKIVDGKLKLEIEAEIKRDYDAQWKGGPARKFFRSVYDKYISSGKQQNVDSMVKDTVNDLISNVKQYLNVK